METSPANWSTPADIPWDWKLDSPFLEELRLDLKALAKKRLRSGGAAAISVSSLVQESLVKLFSAKKLRYPENKRYIYALGARAMRCVIVDSIRAKLAQKRNGMRAAIEIEFLPAQFQSNETDVLSVDEALEKLARKNPRQAQVVEMKFFSGHTMPEIADCLELGLSTVENDWTQAKKFLISAMGE